METKELEQEFRTKVKEMGGILDFKTLSREYLVILPGGCVGFIFIGPLGDARERTIKRIGTSETRMCRWKNHGKEAH